LKGQEGIDNDRNIKLWKRVEDIYEISKKDDEEDEEEVEDTSIFTKAINFFKNRVKNEKKVHKDDKIDDEINIDKKNDEISIDKKNDEINIKDSPDQSTIEDDNIVNFQNFEIMFAKLLWYTTKIDINIDGFQPLDVSHKYITLFSQISDANSKLST